MACGGGPEKGSLVRSEHEELLKKSVLEASSFVAVCILVPVGGRAVCVAVRVLPSGLICAVELDLCC